MTSRPALVVGRTWLTSDIVSIWIRETILARTVDPGQFLGVKPGLGPDPMLRRPLSVADVAGNRLRLIFQVRGRGTEMLARAKPGDYLDVLGPLGKPAPPLDQYRLVVCAGGVGAAPLLYYVRRMKKRRHTQVFLGARSKERLILVDEFQRTGVPVMVATDDGSAGYHGTVTELLVNRIRVQDPEGTGKKYGAQQTGGVKRLVVLACGPKPMLAELVCRLAPFPVWGYIEERMGCGTGICYCCALPRRDGGYTRFCQEGPVVLLNEVIL